MSRLCVVCGGSKGIGRAVSRLLAERGFRVVVLSRNQDAGQATVTSLKGGRYRPYVKGLCSTIIAQRLQVK